MKFCKMYKGCNCGLVVGNIVVFGIYGFKVVGCGWMIVC